jgi:tryptophan synthase beta subunit
VILVNLSGRGDKDVETVQRAMGPAVVPPDGARQP